MLVASAGDIVAVKDSDCPFSSVSSGLSRAMPVIGTVTVMIHVAVYLPSFVVANTTAVPSFIAVTTPDASTVQMFSSEEDHITSFCEASSGVTVAVSVSFPPFASDALVLFSLIPVTGVTTVTLHSAVNSPPIVFTVIVAVPVAIAVTFPFWSTVQTSLLEQDHAIDLFVASAGDTVAVRISDFPFSSMSSFLFRDTRYAGITTVTVHSAVNPPSLVVAVTIAVPVFKAVTLPDESTVHTF